MKIRLVLAALLTLSTSSAIALTTDMVSSRRADAALSGTHQFRAWCANGQDRILRRQGDSAADARALLSSAHAGCRLAWQGRISF